MTLANRSSLFEGDQSFVELSLYHSQIQTYQLEKGHSAEIPVD